MIIESVSFKRVWEWINNVQAESRIASDCKFAGAFRVDIQAYNCQRRI